MFTSSSSLTSLFQLHSSSSSLRPLLFRPQSSYSPYSSFYPPSPHPRAKRPNRLRPKLPKTLIPTPPPPPPPLDESSAGFRQDLLLEDEHLLPLREDEEVVGAEETAAAATVGFEPPAAVAAVERFSPKSVLGLALQFTVLIAVETAVAVWLFGGASSEEKVMGVEQVPNAAEAPKFGSEVGDKVEFEKKVLEIRAMAKEAREEERRELAEDSRKGELSFRMDELRKKADLITLGSSDYSSFVVSPSKKNQTFGKIVEEKSDLAKKVGFLSNHAKSRDAPRGFNGSKSNDKRHNVANGSIEQNAEKDVMDLPSVMQQSSELNVEGSRVTQPSGGVEESTLSQRQKSSKTVQSSFKTIVNIPVGASASDSKTMLEPQVVQTSTNSRTKFTTMSKQAKHQTVNAKDKPLLNKDKIIHTNSKEEPWWLKLPYVLGIFLHRGFKRDGPKGLYSLDISSSSDDEDACSYTIAFQDRGDATNFCFLLESFFQDLGDVSADVVPLTIEELVEAEKSQAFNILVVRKGQLHLYAGQPLHEAEASLRSLLD